MTKEEFIEIEKKYLSGKVNEIGYLTAKGRYEQYVNYGENQEAKKDNINPTHYKGSVQPIDLIEAHELNFNIGNVIKYCTRYQKKGDPLSDLKKAQYYLNREIEILQNKNK